MLKIKDNVDLKELKKFGFKLYHLLYMYKNLVIVPGSLIIETAHMLVSDYSLFELEDYELDTIYDLIKADLVEKVEE